MEKQQSCPKCGERRVSRINVGSDFEEAHCWSCGLVINIGLLTGRRIIEFDETQGRGGGTTFE
jgi:transcription elongation factor Elf1